MIQKTQEIPACSAAFSYTMTAPITLIDAIAMGSGAGMCPRVFQDLVARGASPDAGRRTATRIRIAGAAAQPIAGEPARYEERAYPNTVASSLGCETGRRTVVWIRIAGAAARPIAGEPARYEERAYPNTVASSLGCETGRRTVVRLRIAPTATHPIAACTIASL